MRDYLNGCALTGDQVRALHEYLSVVCADVADALAKYSVAGSFGKQRPKSSSNKVHARKSTTNRLCLSALKGYVSALNNDMSLV